MRNVNQLKKGLVFGIIFLFIGTSVIPSFYGNTIPGSLAAMENNGQINDNEQQKIFDNYASTPLYFTENKGQYPAEVLFQTYAPGATVYLCKNKIISVFTRELNDSIDDDLKNSQNPLEHTRARKPQQTEMISTVAEFVCGNPDAVVSGEHRLSHNNNYFIGNDPLKWQTDVLNYQSVTYQDVYPGIDLTYYGNNGGLKYDFIVSPGADASQIQIRYTGIDTLSVTSNGVLQIETRFGMISENTPQVYQNISGVIYEVQGSYDIRESDMFGFAINHYNPVVSLVIDPELVYSTFLGGNSDDSGWGITVDEVGNAYATGCTSSSDFPIVNPYDGVFNGYLDAFVSKLSPSGNSLVYSTYLGGNLRDGGFGIAVDDSGNAYLTGETVSSDFPLVNPYDSTYNGGIYYGDAFVSKLSPSGNSLVYSTYLGGSDEDFAKGIAVSGSGNAYLIGETVSSDFPMVNPYDDIFSGVRDAFVSELSPSGNSLVYSTYLGGSSTEDGEKIAVDGVGNAYVTGRTSSSDFPIVNPYDGVFNGDIDIFVSKLSPSGNSLVYSTYLGGSSCDEGDNIAIDSVGNAFVTGGTWSSDFPLVNPYDGTYNEGCDIFISKISTDGTSLVYSSYLGGSSFEVGYGIAIDDIGNAYLTGETYSSDFPILNPYDGTYSGTEDAFVSKLSPSGNSLVYSTYLGGNWYDCAFDISVDNLGSAYIIGVTSSSDFPIVNPYDATCDGFEDAFVTKFTIGCGNQPLVADADGPYIGTIGHTIAFDASGSYDSNGSIVGYRWDWTNDEIWDTGWLSSPSTTHVYNLEFHGQVKLQVKDNNDATNIDVADVDVVDHDGDYDQDGLLNGWEINGYDPNGDGTPEVNLPVMGADYKHKDIFVEIDYMEKEGTGGDTHRPNDDAIQKVVDAFNNALVDNPDEEDDGIHLHVDYGSNAPLTWGESPLWGTLSKSNKLTHQEQFGPKKNKFPTNDFDNIKNTYFVETREPIFHYSLWVHNASYRDGYPIAGYSRNDETSLTKFRQGASDFIVSLGWRAGGSPDEQAGTFMHELGHNLGLCHGGFEHLNYKPNYLSVMNYFFSLSGLYYLGTFGTIDYSRFILPTLDESALDETIGLQGEPSTQGYGTEFYDSNKNIQRADSINFAIDWNGDGDKTDVSVSVNINNDTDKAGNPNITTLLSSDDWDELVFDGGLVGPTQFRGKLPTSTNASCINSNEAEAIPVDISVRIIGPGYVNHRPGQNQIYQYTILNKGIFNDSYNISIIAIQNWVNTSSIPSNVTLLSGQSVSFSVQVNIPIDILVGTIGQIKITVMSTSNQMVFDTIQTFIEIIANPLSPIAYTNGPFLGSPNEEIILSGSDSFDSDGQIIDYHWDFGDGTNDTGETKTHSYMNSGNYTIILTVTDNENLTNSTCTFALINTRPYNPINPEPADGEKKVPINVLLSWDGGDPDPNDTVTYDVYFGTTNPPPIIISNQSETTFNPGLMSYGTTYYWEITSWDNHYSLTQGPVWNFTTNYKPNQPYDPNPSNGSTSIPITTELYWIGGDPDPDDTVTYDVYFGTINPPSKIISNQTDTNYSVENLDYSTTYYWQIISWDSQNVSTAGPLWYFTTILDTTPPVTTHSISGTPGNNGWYISGVVVTIYALDNQSGVNHTYYKIDSGDWIESTVPVSVGSDGTHTLVYYSIDIVGNEEPVKGPFSVKIDQTPPSITLTKQKLSFNQVKFTAEVSDETSGIHRVEFTLDGVLQSNDTQSPYEWTWTGIGDHTVTATAYDLAGNSQSQSMSTPVEQIQGFNTFYSQMMQQMMELSLRKQLLS